MYGVGQYIAWYGVYDTGSFLSFVVVLAFNNFPLSHTDELTSSSYSSVFVISFSERSNCKQFFFHYSKTSNILIE